MHAHTRTGLQEEPPRSPHSKIAISAEFVLNDGKHTQVHAHMHTVMTYLYLACSSEHIKLRQVVVLLLKNEGYYLVPKKEGRHWAGMQTC
jgi:hypothetical protein